MFYFCKKKEHSQYPLDFESCKYDPNNTFFFVSVVYFVVVLHMCVWGFFFYYSYLQIVCYLDQYHIICADQLRNSKVRVLFKKNKSTIGMKKIFFFKKQIILCVKHQISPPSFHPKCKLCTQEKNNAFFITQNSVATDMNSRIKI